MEGINIIAYNMAKKNKELKIKDNKVVETTITEEYLTQEDIEIRIDQCDSRIRKHQKELKELKDKLKLYK